MNGHHSSKNAPESLFSTEDLQGAADYIDSLIISIREAHSAGRDLNVEGLTAMTVAAIIGTGIDAETIIVQQALLLSITLQRLAS